MAVNLAEDAKKRKNQKKNLSAEGFREWSRAQRDYSRSPMTEAAQSAQKVTKPELNSLQEGVRQLGSARAYNSALSAYERAAERENTMPLTEATKAARRSRPAKAEENVIERGTRMLDAVRDNDGKRQAWRTHREVSRTEGELEELREQLRQAQGGLADTQETISRQERNPIAMSGVREQYTAQSDEVARLEREIAQRERGIFDKQSAAALGALSEDELAALDTILRFDGRYADALELSLGSSRGGAGGGISKEAYKDAKRLLAEAGMDEDKLQSLLEYRERQRNQEATEQRAALIQSTINEHPVLGGIGGTLISVPMNVVGGFGGAAEAVNSLNYINPYAPVDIYSPALSMSNATNAIREGIMDQVDWNVGGYDLFDAGYGIVTSTADSIAAAYLGGGSKWLGSGIIGLEAGVQNMVDITERGGTAKQAVVGGIAAGVFETLFESFSIGNFNKLKETPVTDIKSIAGNIGKSMLVNGSEEAATEIANIIYDYIALGDISNYALMVQDYMAQGYSEKEAKRLVAKQLGLQVLEAGVTGAIQGGFMSGAGMGFSALQGNTARRSAATANRAVDRAYDAYAESGLFSSEAQDAAENALEAIRSMDLYKEPIGGSARNKQAVETFADTMDTSGAYALRTFYDENTDAEQYIKSMHEFYRAGKNGADIHTVDNTVLNSAQAQAAYLAGQADAAATHTVERSQYASADGKAPGLVMDDYAATLDTGLVDEIHSISKMLGVKTQFADSVAGGIANAQYENGVITIEKNNPNPVRALLGHEMLHRIQEQAPESYGAFRDVVMAEMQNADARIEAQQRLAAQSGLELSREEAMDELAADYAGALIESRALLKQFIANHQQERTLLTRIRDALRGLIERLTGKRREQAQSAEALLSKAVEDAAKNAAAESNGERTAQWLRDNRLQLPFSPTADGSTASISQREEKGKARYSIKHDQDNTPYVVVENDILKDVPKSEWVKTVKDNLRQKFPDGVTVGSNVIQIDGQSTREMTYSKYTQKLMKENPTLYVDKLRATDNVDEILIASRNYVNEALMHPRKDKIQEFARGEVLLRIRDKDYSAQVVVAKRSNGTLLLYDILQLNRVSIQGKEKSEASQPTVTQSGSTRRYDTPDISSIPQDDGKGNSEYSLKGAREMDAAVRELMERADREAGWTEAEIRREINQIAQRVYGEQVLQTRTHYKERERTARSRRSAGELRKKITRHVKDLSVKLLRPSDAKHIPEQLRQPVAELLSAINLESQYTVDPESGKRSKSDAGTPTKRTEAFRAVLEQYEAIAKGRTDFNGVLDPDLLDNLREVVAMKDTRLADMRVEQLETVWKTLRAIEMSVSTANKLLGESRYKGVTELANGIRQSSASKRTKGNWRGVTGWGDRLLNLDMLNPLTFLHLFGDGGDALYHELQVARDNKTRILKETVDLAQKAIGTADVNKLRKQARTFQVGGGTLTLTTPQLMSLYDLNKREQAQEHIYMGGLRAENAAAGPSKDKRAGENIAVVLGKVESSSEGVKVTKEDVASMLSVLSETERKIADGLQAIMQGYLADQGNRESMKVFGYEKFTEENYFPISSDPHQVVDKIGDLLEGGKQRPRSVSEWGSAKGTVAGANNGILLGDIFDVFAQHAVDMATYASHLGVLEDMNRVRNFQFRDDEGNRTGSMKDVIQRVAGQGGEAYLNKLLQDVSAGTAKDSVTGLGRLTANYKAASVGANIRVVLQQPSSYPRAAAVMNPKYLADPRVVKKGGWEKALKYAPIAQWKDWGYFEVNQGRSIQNVMFNTDGRLDKLRSGAMGLASRMDSLTWGCIWNACELEIADNRADLVKGSEAFYQAVAARFTDIIDQTQVVDNVLGRSQIMRSGDNLSKMATSYMGEPTQSYNLVYRAFRDWSQEQDNAKRTVARKRLGRSIIALTASQFMNAIAQALWDAVRDDEDRDRKYWERVLSYIPGNFADNINPLGMIPFAKDVLSIWQGYDVKRMDMQVIASFISACQNMSKAINGEGRYTLSGASANLLAEAARIFGLPAATIKRDIEAIARSVSVGTGDWYAQYWMERALNHIGYSGNRKEFYDIAFGALRDGKLEVYQRIVQDLMAQGVKAATIESAMRARLKTAQEEDPQFKLGQAARDLIGSRDSYGAPETESEKFTAESLDPATYKRYSTQRAKTYREMMNTLEAYPAFSSLDNEAKNKLLSAAESLADKIALADNSDGQYKVDTKWMLWATSGEKYGVDEAEAILFKVAYDMTEGTKDRNGNVISDSKKENVMDAVDDLMPWLTREEKNYLQSMYWTSGKTYEYMEAYDAVRG